MPSDAELWNEVGREAVGMELDGARFDVEKITRELTMKTLYQDDDPSAEQIREARMAMNRCRRVLEEYVAPPAGCEPWGDPVPEMPYGRARDVYHCGDDR